MVAAAGVKGLVDARIQRVPDEYVRTPTNGSRVHAIEDDEESEMPVVDLSGIEDNETKRALVVGVVQRACQEWGFFQLAGHGIPLELMESMSQLVHAFFNMPAEERMRYYSNDMTRSFRFGTSFNPVREKTKLWVDYLYHGCNPPPKEQELPNNIPHYWETTRDYSKQVCALASKLLALLSEGLGLGPGALEKRMAGPLGHALKMNYYPPCPNPELAVGTDEHSDVGGLTILQQDNGVEGLQVLHKGRWVNVKPLPGAFVINIADQIQILTNGKYKSVQHRVEVNATKPRVSIASFFSPHLDTFIAPIVELLGEDAPIYRGCKYGDYRNSYFSTDFTNKRPLDSLKI